MPEVAGKVLKVFQANIFNAWDHLHTQKNEWNLILLSLAPAPCGHLFRFRLTVFTWSYGLVNQCTNVANRVSSGLETGWDLGPFAAVLAPGQTSPRATKCKETLWD